MEALGLSEPPETSWRGSVLQAWPHCPWPAWHPWGCQHAHPPSAASLFFVQAHNTVNRRLGKPTFNCALVESRWAGLECEDEDGLGHNACSLDVGRRRR